VTGNPFLRLCHFNRIERKGKFFSVSNVCFKIESIEETEPKQDPKKQYNVLDSHDAIKHCTVKSTSLNDSCTQRV
jgi:hypothetical protein